MSRHVVGVLARPKAYACMSCFKHDNGPREQNNVLFLNWQTDVFVQVQQTLRFSHDVPVNFSE